MRKHLPLLLILLAVVAGYVLFTDDEGALPEGGLEDGLAGEDTPPRAVETADPLEAKGLERTARGPKKRRLPRMPVDPRTLPKGVLVVQPLGPDLEPLVDPGLRLYARTQGQVQTKLPLYDEATGSWRFRALVAGQVTLRAEGDHIVPRSITARVAADRETKVDLHLEIAGAVSYDVVTYAKTKPEMVRIEVFDSMGAQVEAWFQERSPRRMTQARKQKTATQGPTGVMFGLRPGAYRVKVTNVATDEWDSVEVQVAGGTTHPVTLEVRR